MLVEVGQGVEQEVLVQVVTGVQVQVLQLVEVEVKAGQYEVAGLLLVHLELDS